MTTTATRLNVIAYGGGVQSTALLVLAAQGRIDYPVFLFANVGDDSEDPATLQFVHRYAMPYAAAHGIALHELHRVRRDGTTETLYGRLTRPGSRSLPIPVRMPSGAPGTRSCTADFKIKITGRWLKAHGATPDNPARVGIGISLDEIHRVNNRRAMPYEQPVYPLLEHDPPLRRRDCESIIAAAGLPVPGKSACWFVPTEATRVLERATPRPAGPVRAGLPVGGPTQSAPHRAGQAPGVVDRTEPAAAHHPRGAGHAARLQR